MTARNSHVDVPVLLLSYNRPEKLKKVIESLRSAGMRNIYLWSDGPKSGSRQDKAKVMQCRELGLKQISWGCQLKVLFARQNHGCRAGVTRALDWFFSTVDEGIILEDDCVPNQDFFPYCATLLEKYRKHDEVMCISGDNSAGLLFSHGASYSFTRYPMVWGWATWRRAWAQNDAKLSNWSSMRSDREARRRIWPRRKERAMWKSLLDGILEEQKPDTWDYIWSFTIQVSRGLAIVPRVNLISNIGFDPEATHTKYLDDRRANRPTFDLREFRHPEFQERDMYVENQILGEQLYRTSSRTRRYLELILGKTLSFFGIRELPKFL